MFRVDSRTRSSGFDTFEPEGSLPCLLHSTPKDDMPALVDYGRACSEGHRQSRAGGKLPTASLEKARNLSRSS